MYKIISDSAESFNVCTLLIDCAQPTPHRRTQAAQPTAKTKHAHGLRPLLPSPDRAPSPPSHPARRRPRARGRTSVCCPPPHKQSTRSASFHPIDQTPKHNTHTARPPLLAMAPLPRVAHRHVGACLPAQGAAQGLFLLLVHHRRRRRLAPRLAAPPPPPTGGWRGAGRRRG